MALLCTVYVQCECLLANHMPLYAARVQVDTVFAAERCYISATVAFHTSKAPVNDSQHAQDILMHCGRTF